MKLCWFDNHRLGLIESGALYDVSEALRVLPAAHYPSPPGDTLMAHLSAIRTAIGEIKMNATKRSIDKVKLRSPVASPTKIIGAPVNYLKHVEEADEQSEVFAQYRGTIREQGLFLKANSALIGCGEEVRVRFPQRRTDHEMELGVVIGRSGDKIREADALDHVAGYCIALDMVVRGTEDRSFRKSLDTYAVLGPWLVTADEIENPNDLDFKLLVNGELRQASNTTNMILNVQSLIAWASTFYTLWPGDIIMTGTCEGVGPVVPGDTMHCEIERIGRMDVGVVGAELFQTT